ncbi:MAG: hypothetical protein M3527_04045 [Actinomycetota bacterium]|nr:hypothetical protein [Acidimicrobiia bacterium]MDQ3293606.1 hypothetical protein [Actinomycetota bacterium]
MDVGEIADWLGLEGIEAGPTAERFVGLCLAQVNSSEADADQDELDGSSLIQWGCAQLGVSVAGDARDLIGQCEPQSVSDAAATRGALLYGSPGSGSSTSGRIGVSVGAGASIVDASGGLERVAVRAIPWTTFDRGGLLPGIAYPTT